MRLFMVILLVFWALLVRADSLVRWVSVDQGVVVANLVDGEGDLQKKTLEVKPQKDIRVHGAILLNGGNHWALWIADELVVHDIESGKMTGKALIDIDGITRIQVRGSNVVQVNTWEGLQVDLRFDSSGRSVSRTETKGVADPWQKEEGYVKQAKTLGWSIVPRREWSGRTDPSYLFSFTGQGWDGGLARDGRSFALLNELDEKSVTFLVFEGDRTRKVSFLVKQHREVGLFGGRVAIGDAIGVLIENEEGEPARYSSTGFACFAS